MVTMMSSTTSSDLRTTVAFAAVVDEVLDVFVLSLLVLVVGPIALYETTNVYVLFEYIRLANSL